MIYWIFVYQILWYLSSYFSLSERRYCANCFVWYRTVSRKWHPQLTVYSIYIMFQFINREPESNKTFDVPQPNANWVTVIEMSALFLYHFLKVGRVVRWKKVKCILICTGNNVEIYFYFSVSWLFGIASKIRSNWINRLFLLFHN